MTDEQAEQFALRFVQLRQALRYFIADPRFVVTVGGNPIVVEKMLDRVRAIYEETAP